MGMKNLPVLRNKNLARRVQEAAARRDAFVQKAGALRKATGKKETRTLSCVCVRTGQHFSVIFDRVSENHNFQVSCIEKHERSTVKKRAPFKGLLAGSKPTVKSFDANDFDFSGWVCPYCGNEHPINCTACGHVVCGDRMRVLPNGRESFACHDACGGTGTLVPCNRVSATSGASGQSGNGSTKRLPQSSRPRLTCAPPGSAGAGCASRNLKGRDNPRLERPR